MGQAVEQSRGHLRAAEHSDPFAEVQVRGDDDARVLIKLAQQLEEQGSPRRAERQVSQFIQDQERSKRGDGLIAALCMATGGVFSRSWDGRKQSPTP